ncbi:MULTISPECIES: hypothetical protein [unclassified Bradyrhizobium]|uniref:hypothetical protein n=1 Tax=unclassified Bradyrhizobium TaxID=2631580 RepID=UPI001FF9763E|nr:MULTISPECIES: hypothetical protein [unclassified Bradyrhizobium]MCK1296759.1 hypothetical protein [Bradyrhizobium sp. 37]MCK1768995.1 hypothetical protein [Bradyrhizobium sp. 134]
MASVLASECARHYLGKNELRSFAPAEPTIFANASGELGLLGKDAPLRLVQFYNSLAALRRDIRDIADGLTGNPANARLVRQVASPFNPDSTPFARWNIWYRMRRRSRKPRLNLTTPLARLDRRPMGLFRIVSINFCDKKNFQSLRR